MLCSYRSGFRQEIQTKCKEKQEVDFFMFLSKRAAQIVDFDVEYIYGFVMLGGL